MKDLNDLYNELEQYNIPVVKVDFENKKMIAVTWTGVNSFSGSDIWTDGSNYYYSYENDHYVASIASTKWTKLDWSSEGRVFGNSIWTDGTNCYYSSGSNQYVFVKA